MQKIRAGLGHDRDLRPRPLPVFGPIRVREHIELTHRVDSQQVAAHAARSDRKLARPGVFNAIQQEQVVHRAPSRYCECVPVARTGLRALQRVIDGPGVKGEQIVEAAPVERQILDLGRADESGNRRSGRVDQRSLSRKRHLLDELANLQSQVHDRFLADREVDPQPYRRLESRLFRLHLLRADCQCDDTEIASIIGEHSAGGPGFESFDGDGRRCDSSAGFILHSSGDRAGHLRPSVAFTSQQRQDPNE